MVTSARLSRRETCICEIPTRAAISDCVRPSKNRISTIAARVGISQMHVSRLLRRALVTMRGRLEAIAEEQP